MKELHELDRNTVQYMIDGMQEVIDAQKEDLSRQKEVIYVQEMVKQSQNLQWQGNWYESCIQKNVRIARIV